MKPPQESESNFVGHEFTKIAGKFSGPCVVIGEGPSASIAKDNKYALTPKIGINRTKLLGVPLEFWLANDIMPQIVEHVPTQCWYRYKTTSYKDPSWTQRTGKIRSGITIVRALSVAYQLGFNEIFVCGVDLGDDGNGHYYFDEIERIYPPEIWPCKLHRMGIIETVVYDTISVLKKNGICVIDTSPMQRIMKLSSRPTMADTNGG